MSRYAALPAENQFELGSDSDDDSDDGHVAARPARPSSPTSDPLLNPRSRSPSPGPVLAQPVPQQASTLPPNEIIFSADEIDDPAPSPPGGYDYPPPPGSPPPFRARGNSNGVTLPSDFHVTQPGPSVFRRALGAILPTHYGRTFRAAMERGGGMRNDGVFGNMNAKPGQRPGIQRGIDNVDNPDWVPETTQAVPPPSYVSAQADTVPPYYEAALGTSGHTFTSPLSPSSQLLIDNLPPGSLFSFLWNLLVSLSFQFVGFLLTYLLHTSHAAKQGSRAGLGITLIQYGFYLRQRAESMAQGADGQIVWGHMTPSGAEEDAPEPVPSFATAAEADAYYANPNVTLPSSYPSAYPDGALAAFPRELSVANEWLSFFLMTIGWFVLLTSVLSYWRVKRWERTVRAQAEERERAEAAATGPEAAGDGTSSAAAPAEPERQRMAAALHGLLERAGLLGVGFDLPARLGGRRSEEPAGSAEEGHRLEAVD